MNTIYYFSVLHSLVIADEFTGEDMENSLAPYVLLQKYIYQILFLFEL
jgi:hypothetical protein